MLQTAQMNTPFSIIPNVLTVQRITQFSTLNKEYVLHVLKILILTMNSEHVFQINTLLIGKILKTFIHHKDLSLKKNHHQLDVQKKFHIITVKHVKLVNYHNIGIFKKIHVSNAQREKPST